MYAAHVNIFNKSQFQAVFLQLLSFVMLKKILPFPVRLALLFL